MDEGFIDTLINSKSGSLFHQEYFKNGSNLIIVKLIFWLYSISANNFQFSIESSNQKSLNYKLVLLLS